MTTSQWLVLATSGFRASAVSTASPSSLYIFQFPAITGFLIIELYLDLCALFLVLYALISSTWAEGSRTKYKAQSTKLGSGVHLLFSAATPGNSLPARNSSVAPP